MPHIITVIAYPRDMGIWKVRLSGITEHQFTMLRGINPCLKRQSYGTFLTAKWRSQGAGHGRFIPMPYITPVLNILEDWGYSLVSVDDVEKHSGLGKIWTFRLSRYNPHVDGYLSSRWWTDRYNYYHPRYPTLAHHYWHPSLALPPP